MVLDRSFCDEERLSDLTIGGSPGNERQNLSFAFRQLLNKGVRCRGRWRLRRCRWKRRNIGRSTRCQGREHFPGDLWLQKHLPFCCRAYGRRKLFGGNVFD